MPVGVRRYRSKFNVDVSAAGKLRRTVDGQLCDSAAEARRYRVLKALEAVGEITRLRFHPRFKLIVNTTPITTYEADFDYYDRTGQYVVEDCKGMVTESFRLKKRLMLALHGLTVTEVR